MFDMLLPLVWLAFTSLAGAVPTPDLVTRQNACAPVHLIVARGSTEFPGEGATGIIASRIKTRIPEADSEALVYPATLQFYQSSEGQGTAAMTKAVKSYVDRCPNSKIVLMGYSQGGQVAMDSLCGTSEPFFAKTAPLAAKYAARIVVFGDPSHAVNQSWNAGTSTKNGILPRADNAACKPSASKIRSYCDTGDQFCDSGLNIFTHLTYITSYGDDATNFVVAKVS